MCVAGATGSDAPLSPSQLWQQSQQCHRGGPRTHHQTPHATCPDSRHKHPHTPDVLTLPHPRRSSRTPECAQSLRPELPNAAATTRTAAAPRGEAQWIRPSGACNDSSPTNKDGTPHGPHGVPQQCAPSTPCTYRRHLQWYVLFVFFLLCPILYCL